MIIAALFLLALQLSASQLKGKRLISLSDNDAKWMTDKEVLGLIQKNIRFVDVTDFDPNVYSNAPSKGCVQCMH